MAVALPWFLTHPGEAGIHTPCMPSMNAAHQAAGTGVMDPGLAGMRDRWGCRRVGLPAKPGNDACCGVKPFVLRCHPPA